MGEVGSSPGSRAALKRDWTKGSIIRNLLSLSWPMVITEGVWGLGMALDMVWVGKLGSASVAGVGIAFAAIILGITLYMGFITAANAIVARFVGAGDIQGAHHVARQAFALIGALSIVMTLVGIFLAEPILSLFGVEAAVIKEGATYMRIVFAGWIVVAFYDLCLRLMQTSGDAVTPMKIMVFFIAIHILLSPFLTLGWWVFPPLGVRGTALTYIISHSLGTSLSLWAFLTGRTRLRLSWRHFRLDPNILWRITKIAIPASFMGTQRSLGDLVLMWFMAAFGTLGVAAQSVIRRVDMLIRLPSSGVALAAGILVGQNLGANQPGRAERGGWLAVAVIESFIIIAAVAILLRAENIISIFTTEPSLLKIASTFLRIATAEYIGSTLAIIFQRCLLGAGDALPVMLVSILIVWVVEIPLAFFLPRITDLGMYGIRWAIVAGMLVGAIAYITYFRMGRWKLKKV